MPSGSLGPSGSTPSSRMTLVGSVHPHSPGRTMTDHSLFLIPGHIRVAHAREIIVRLVIFSDMFEAEAKILPFPQPAIGARCSPIARTAG